MELDTSASRQSSQEPTELIIPLESEQLLAVDSASILGKRATHTRPGLKIRIPPLAPLSQAIVAGKYGPLIDFDAPKPKRSKTATTPRGKHRDRRNANAGRIGSDMDIGFVRMRVLNDEGESEVDVPENRNKAKATSTNKGWRPDGIGPPVMLEAGLMLTQLLAVFSNDHGSQLEQLISYLKNPEEQAIRALGNKTDMASLISDLNILETDAAANELLYMCKLIQLVLNVDQ